VSDHSTAVAGDPVRLFMELAALPSPSRCERAVADLVTSRLRALGLEVVEDEAGVGVGGDTGNLVCRVPGAGGLPCITLAAHLDTVEPTGPLQPVLEDGVIRNAGGTVLGADNKAAVAALLHVTEALVRSGRPFPAYELVFTVAEELGVQGARYLPPDVPSAPFGVVFDSSGPVGGIVLRSPSQQTITAEFRGRAAHSGLEPERGASAILAAAHAISLMELGRLDEETTANVGVIRGGVARNIVPALCIVESECRSHDEATLAQTTAAMVHACQEGAARAGVDVDVDLVLQYRSFRLPKTDPVVRAARDALTALGLEPNYLTSGGGSDANVFNLRGTPTVNLDCGMMSVHTPEEHIRVAELERLVDLVERLIENPPPPPKEKS